MFFEIHLASDLQNFSRGSARNGDDPVVIGGDDVAGVDRNAVAHNGNIRSAESVVTHGSGRHNAQSENGEADLLQVGDVAHAAVDHRPRKIACSHRGAHQASHAGDIGTILDHHDVYRVRSSLIDSCEHAAERVRIFVFFLFQQY